MNQILSTEDPNKKKTKQKMNSPEFNKIVKVFAIAIFIFGAALIGVYSYKLINKSKINKIAKPEIVLDQVEDEATISAKAEGGIEKITYYWDLNDKTEKSLNGTSEYSESIAIPKGTNTLTVKVIDRNAQEFETSKEYTGTKDTEKPLIDLDKTDGTNITVTDETELAYATYRWEDEPEENTVKVEAEPKEGETVAKEINIKITAKKGTNTLIITAVDAAGNTEISRKTYVGKTDPEIEVYREGDKLYLKITHELGFKKVEFSVNGQTLAYDQNFSGYDATKKELFYYFNLKEGKNEVAIVATKSSPPMWPTNASVLSNACMCFVIIFAVNFIISSPFKNPYTSLYALKLSKSIYNTTNGSFFNSLFLSSVCIGKFPGNPVSGLTVLFTVNNLDRFFII